MFRIISALCALALARSVLGACSVPGITGSYSRHIIADFSSKTAADDVQSVLNAAGFTVSQFPVSSLGASFQSDAVNFVDGALQLSVRAQEGATRPSAQLVTAEKMLYGSMRTVLKSSTTPGVCEGAFFYANDQAEIDWEILTHNRAVWATNRKTSASSPETSGAVPFGDPTSAYHEYRVDWDPTKTVFFIDGVQYAEYTDNVPQIDGNFILNVWSNGDPTWSAGPPSADSHTLVKSVEIFTGYSPDSSTETCTSTLGGSPAADVPALGVVNLSANKQVVPEKAMRSSAAKAFSLGIVSTVLTAFGLAILG